MASGLPLSSPTDSDTPNFFKQVHNLFIKFIWARKHPRLPSRRLSLPKQYGGLAVPDVLKYYQATHSGRRIDWCHHCDIKLWAQIEHAQTDIPLKSALECYEALPTSV